MYLSIHYHTTFAYPEPAQQSHSLLRAAPATTPVQRPLAYRLTTDPAARTHTYVDYWGTIVEAFGIRAPHDELAIRVEAVVDTDDTDEAPDTTTLAELTRSSWADRHWELLQPSAHVQLTAELRDFAHQATRGSTAALGAVDALTAAVHERMVYTPGATQIGETTDAVLAKNQGVCQDYAHLMVGACRALGLPARYVSGYLYARDSGVDHEGEAVAVVGDDDEPQDDSIEVLTHAWVEVRLPEADWVARDPTNHLAVGERHVRIGAGRDYDDVAPLRGTYVGTTEPLATVGVEMRRLNEPSLVNPALHQHHQQQQ